MSLLFDIQRRYNRGLISKPSYIRRMYDRHSALFEYPEFIKSTDIAKIDITGDGIQMTTRRFHTTFICPPEDLRAYPIEILNFNEYELNEFNLLNRFIGPHAVIFDIGANMGWYSINIAATRRDVKIFSFEPIPQTYDYLKKNIRLNNLSNVQTYNIGLSNREKRLTFYYYPEGAGNASSKNVSKSRHITRIICPVKKMDTVARQIRHKVDVIKCDVEGAELSVFKGGIETIRRDKPVIFSEMLRKWTKEFNYNPNDIIALLSDAGYMCFAIHGSTLKNFKKMDKRTKETNFIFLHGMKHRKEISAL